MVQLIVGNKGKGKTKVILDKVNSEVLEVAGNIVYLDKSTKHMFELNNKVRLIDVSEYLIDSADQFVGFVTGIISQDHDLQQIYLDSFMIIACVEKEGIEATILKLDKISEKFGVDIVISVSYDPEEVPASLKEKVIVAL